MDTEENSPENEFCFTEKTASPSTDAEDQMINDDTCALGADGSSSSRMYGSEDDKIELSPLKRKWTDTTAEENDNCDQDFVWQDYLEETGSIAAPPQAFAHVEHSLETGFKVGMKMEVPTRDKPDSYWLASVIMTCGPLLSLRYVGYGDDRSSDFWFDVKSGDVHPVGWCAENNKPLCPPDAIIEKVEDWKTLLDSVCQSAVSLPSHILEEKQAGTIPIDLIKQGMKVEIQKDSHPVNVWIATVVENVGGRLLLRYDGMDSASHDFWLFYLSHRLHLIGWSQAHGCQYWPPEVLHTELIESKWREVIRNSLNEAENMKILPEIMEPQEQIEPHGFKVGMKLEAINPSSGLQLWPATVSRIISSKYFIVVVDDYVTDDSKLTTLYCHSNYLFIFPINWGKENNIEVHCSKEYLEKSGNKEFDWQEYLAFYKAEPAPQDLFQMSFMNLGFESGMKLEAVNPIQPHQICAATITAVVDPLMWIQLDSMESSQPHFILPVNSQDVFPVGWCESNGYPLKPPHFAKQQWKKPKNNNACSSDSAPKMKKVEPVKLSSQKDSGKAWCPKIYFNHRCFSGPFLSKSRLAELPKQVGPGSVSLVMKEVLTLLINVAYKSSRVLKELQLHGKPDPSMQQQVLKAKYKGKSYRAVVEVVRRSNQVEEFCRKICTKLECCPYLFGPHHVGEECPEKCYTLTKTKYTHNFVKKQKKAGRPPLVLRNGMMRGPGKKKKQYFLLQTNRDSSSQESNDEKEKQCSPADDKITAEKENSTNKASTASETGTELRTIRKYNKFIPPRSGIVTRGAKLPNFGIEMKWRHHFSFLPRKVGRPPLCRPQLCRSPSTYVARRVGRPSNNTRSSVANTSGEVPKKENAENSPLPLSDNNKSENIKTPLLDSNPLDWTVNDVVKYIRSTDCAPIARALQEQEIDGQALLLLTLQAAQEFLELKLDPAIKLCCQIERVKLAFYTQFAN